LGENATDASSVASLLAYEPADTSEPVLDITIGDALWAAAARWPDRPALIGLQSAKQGTCPVTKEGICA